MERMPFSLYICRLYISVYLAWSGELEDLAGYVHQLVFSKFRMLQNMGWIYNENIPFVLMLGTLRTSHKYGTMRDVYRWRLVERNYHNYYLDRILLRPVEGPSFCRVRIVTYSQPDLHLPSTLTSILVDLD